MVVFPSDPVVMRVPKHLFVLFSVRVAGKNVHLRLTPALPRTLTMPCLSKPLPDAMQLL